MCIRDSSIAMSRWFNTQRASPRYGIPTETFSLNGGTIIIEYQGAPEDVTQLGSQPDLSEDALTAWVSGSLIETISNNQYIRFRVRFSVPEDHDFSADLPEVDEIDVPVTF